MEWILCEAAGAAGDAVREGAEVPALRRCRPERQDGAEAPRRTGMPAPASCRPGQSLPLVAGPLAGTEAGWRAAPLASRLR